jgi:hypothetical protein
MIRLSIFAATSFAAALALPAVAAERHRITPEEVTAAIHAAGMTASPEQVEMLAEVAASSKSPQLKVDSMERWEDRGFRVRLSCLREECLPFFVAVRGLQPEATSASSPASASAARPDNRPTPDPRSLSVQAGSRQIFLLEGPHIHIQIPVVCLEGGSVGQRIRVTSLDHRQSYIAQIDGNNILRGKIQ